MTEKAALDLEQENTQQCKPTADIESVSYGMPQTDMPNEMADFGIVAFKEIFLERAAAPWQFGGCPSLNKVLRDTLQFHQD